MSDLEQQKKLGDETENKSDEGGEGEGRGRGEEGVGGVVESLDNSSYISYMKEKEQLVLIV